MAWDNKKSNNNFFGYDYSTLLKNPNWNPDEQNVTHMEMKTENAWGEPFTPLSSDYASAN